MFILRSLQNPKWYVQIGTTPIHIGRSSDNTLVLNDKTVSRTHAIIQLDSGGLTLTDLNSTQGTFVNAVQVKRRRVNPGDVISFGTVQWRVEESSPDRSGSISPGLLLISISNPKQQFPLTISQINIGRSKSNQLRIRNNSISREHAIILFENGKYFVIDKDSTSGTFVNHKRVQRAVLNPGDVIAFGEEQWRVMPMGPAGQPLQQLDVSRIRIGGYTLSPDPVYGGVVQPVGQGQKTQLQDIQTPIFIRPCHFGTLVNRKAEVKTAASSGPNSPVQFYGPPGTGKSTILCYLAHHPFADTFPDGVVHLLARGRGVIDLLQDIFNAFYDQPRGFVATEAEVRHHLQSKNALILLDDVELNPDETSEMIAAAPKCTLILASTKKCLPQGGRIMELKGFKTREALELFAKVIGRALNSEELPPAKMICTALQNNPVRIIQAASYVRDIQQTLGELTNFLRVASPLDALYNLIVQSLSEVEGYVVAILAALDGGSIHNRHLPALIGTDNTKAVLDGLIGRGLVKEMDNRYSLTGTFVAYLQQKWDLSEWSIRILDHFISWVERHQEEPDYVLFETEAILAILTWAARAGKWQRVLRLCRGVESLMMIGKQWSTWETVLQWSLQAAQALGDKAAEAWAYHQLGTRAMCLGDTASANASLEQAYQIRQSLGDRVGAELTRNNQSLLSVSPPVPPKPPTPKLITKPSPGFLRPLFLVGGAAVVVVTAALIITNRPSSPPPTPIQVPDTATVHAPAIEPDTATPSKTPKATDTPTKTPTITPTKYKTITPTMPTHVSVDFWADDYTIEKGESTTLHWDVFWAEEVYWLGENTDHTASVDVSPSATTTYLLEIYGEDGEWYYPELTINVLLPPESVSVNFWADNSTIEKGESTTLHWNVISAKEVYWNGSSTYHKARVDVSPSTTTTYKLEIYGEDGKWYYPELTITVLLPPEPVILYFRADDDIIISDTCTSLHWGVENAWQVYLNGTPVDSYGEESTCPRNTTTYTLSVEAGSGITKKEIVVRTLEPYPPPGSNLWCTPWSSYYGSTYYSPQVGCEDYDSAPLDICLEVDINCGANQKPAADGWCRVYTPYGQAKSWEIDPVKQYKTRYIDSYSGCNSPRVPTCTTFKSITCDITK